MRGTRSVTKMTKIQDLSKRVVRSWQLYLLFLLPLLFILVFHYGPMYGAQIAFKDFRVNKGIMGSPWVGFKHFTRFLQSYQFVRLLGNTLGISVYSLLAGFPFPIILALSLNTVRYTGFKKTVQMVTYAPHFISTVVMVGIILQVLAPRNGLMNQFIMAFGGESIDILSRPEFFKSIYVWSGVWQSAGYSAIIYLAALSSIDPGLHEAAIMDGATVFQRILHIDFPGILPTAVILLIMNTGHILNVGFEKIFLMQNPLNIRTSEVISTYVYKIGLASPTTNYSYPAAIGLFSSAVGLALLLIVNKMASKLGETSLW